MLANIVGRLVASGMRIVPNSVAGLIRYGLATAGPVGVAVSQFVLTLQQLHVMSDVAFGSFSFLMVTSQFCLGLWSALFGAPLPILLHQAEETGDRTLLKSAVVANLYLSFAVLVVFWLLGLTLSVASLDAGLFATYVALNLSRTFARSYGYASSRPFLTILSDIVYAIALFLGAAIIWMSQTTSPTAPMACLLIGAAAAMLPFAWIVRVSWPIGLSLRSAMGYSQIWKRYSSWSLLGVVTTEATGNSHAYLVTLLSGPAAFAPLAASALLTRPIGVVMNALTEFERPQLVKKMSLRHFKEVLTSVRLFRFTLVAAWVISTLASAWLVYFHASAVFPVSYDYRTMVIGLALWTLIALVRVARTPESTLLQAAGEFRVLAYATVQSCTVSLVAVVFFVLAIGPLWSLVGILIGEMVSTLTVWRQAALWSRASRLQSGPSFAK